MENFECYASGKITKMELDKIEILKNARLSFNDYLLLLSKVNSEYTPYLSHFLGNPEDLERKLIRRGFINSDGSISEVGSNLLGGNFEIPQTVEVLSNNEKELKQFEEFWNSFPVTDKWGHWPKTRILRNDKPRALKYYRMALRDVTHKDLMAALKQDIELKQKNSIVRNEMVYMPAICAWLNRRNYEGFLADSQESSEEKTRFGEDVE